MLVNIKSGDEKIQIVTAARSYNFEMRYLTKTELAILLYTCAIFERAEKTQKDLEDKLYLLQELHDVRCRFMTFLKKYPAIIASPEEREEIVVGEKL